MKEPDYEHKFKPYGELEYCCRCMGLEGSMPTDCPGEAMTTEESNQVYAGHTDFIRGVGWTKQLSTMGRIIVQSHFYKVTKKTSDCEGLLMEDIFKDFPEEVHPHIKKYLEELKQEYLAKQK